MVFALIMVEVHELKTLMYLKWQFTTACTVDHFVPKKCKFLLEIKTTTAVWFLVEVCSFDIKMTFNEFHLCSLSCVSNYFLRIVEAYAWKEYCSKIWKFKPDITTIFSTFLFQNNLMFTFFKTKQKTRRLFDLKGSIQFSSFHTLLQFLKSNY